MWLFRSGLVLLIYTSLCVYTGSRVFAWINYLLPGAKALVFWPAFILLYYSFMAINLFSLDRFTPLRQFSMYSLAVILYLFLTLGTFDLLRLILYFTRRNLLSPRFSALGIGAAIGLTFLIILCGAIHARIIYIKNYHITIAKSGPLNATGDSNLRIALISDLHIGGTVDRAWIARIVDKVTEVQPDLVCIAGDVFDGNLDMVKDIPGVAAELRRMKAPLGVYACLGNHDVDRMRLFQDSSGTERIAAFLREANITLLQDEAALVKAGGEEQNPLAFYVAGRRDARPIGMRQERLSVAELTAPLDREKVLILLDHQPTQFPQAQDAGVDLLFCGHSHRGQIFPGNLITRHIFRKAGGTHYGYWQGGTMQGVVTSGAGLWGPPLRVGSNAEVAVIELSLRREE